MYTSGELARKPGRVQMRILLAGMAVALAVQVMDQIQIATAELEAVEQVTLEVLLARCHLD
jgi:hypothetical protein